MDSRAHHLLAAHTFLPPPLKRGDKFLEKVTRTSVESWFRVEASLGSEEIILPMVLKYHGSVWPQLDTHRCVTMNPLNWQTCQLMCPSICFIHRHKKILILLALGNKPKGPRLLPSTWSTVPSVSLSVTLTRDAAHQWTVTPDRSRKYKPSSLVSQAAMSGRCWGRRNVSPILQHPK